jgi:hypothetical protein
MILSPNPNIKTAVEPHGKFILPKQATRKAQGSEMFPLRQITELVQVYL